MVELMLMTSKPTAQMMEPQSAEGHGPEDLPKPSGSYALAFAGFSDESGTEKSIRRVDNNAMGGRHTFQTLKHAAETLGDRPSIFKRHKPGISQKFQSF